MKLRIIRQLAPRDRVRVGPNAPKSVEGRDGVGHLTADLLDLEIPDRPNAAPVGGIDGRALDPITPDGWVGALVLSACSMMLSSTAPHLDEARQLRTAPNVMHRS